MYTAHVNNNKSDKTNKRMKFCGILYLCPPIILDTKQEMNTNHFTTFRIPEKSGIVGMVHTK
jgi:hypothetical protein